VPYKRIQIESRVERFERLLQCEKLLPLDALKPTARKVLKSLHRNGRGEIRAAMDRTMINDTINLLFITVAYGGRALPLGWVRVPHEGNSDLKLQQRLLNWFVECLPEGARRRTTIIADREFHSIHLATWIGKTLRLNFVLGSRPELAWNSSGIGTGPETWPPVDGRGFGNLSKSAWTGRPHIESIW
jgi:hypothetical protein